MLGHGSADLDSYGEEASPTTSRKDDDSAVEAGAMADADQGVFWISEGSPWKPSLRTMLGANQ